MTTNHSFAGSCLISDNTWYYTTITIGADHQFIVNSASGNYAGEGGSIFHGDSGAIDDALWAHIGNATIFAGLGDNYGGANARITMGEVLYDTQEPPIPTPEPATIILFTCGMVAWAGQSVRVKKETHS